MFKRLKKLFNRDYVTSPLRLEHQAKIEDLTAELDLFKGFLKLTHEANLKLIEQHKAMKEERDNIKNELEFVKQLEAYYRKWYKEVSYKLSNPRDQKGRFCGVTVAQ